MYDYTVNIRKRKINSLGWLEGAGKDPREEMEFLYPLYPLLGLTTHLSFNLYFSKME